MESGRTLSVGEISVTFGGITALDDVSLEVSSGEVLGVIGPNGAGKTTLFNVICGFVEADAGRLSWRGETLTGIRPHRLAGLGIARTLQGVGLFPRMTVLENVMVGAQRFRRTGLAGALLGLPRSDREERSLRDRALATLDRVDCAVRRPAPGDPSLRGAEAGGARPRAGLRARVAVARRARRRPRRGRAVRVDRDDPLAGSSIAVMLVDHHMDLVTSVCDRVVVLDFGRVIASGVPPEVRQNPRVLEAYLGREADAAEAPVTGERGDARG